MSVCDGGGCKSTLKLNGGGGGGGCKSTLKVGRDSENDIDVSKVTARDSEIFFHGPCCSWGGGGGGGGGGSESGGGGCEMDMFVGGGSGGGRERRLRGAVGTVAGRGWR